MLDFKKYKRFFAFGCSFTEYKWPTWADLIAQEIPESYNYGLGGAGNVFMHHRFIEAHTRHRINSDDLVIVTWTNCAREDRYVDNRWICPGNIYTQTTYDVNWIKKYSDIRGYFIRDLAVITSTKLILDGLGVDYHFHSMVPLTNIDQYAHHNVRIDDVEKLYAQTLKAIKPSYFEALFNFDWLSRQPRPRAYNNGRQYPDPHPTPTEHLEYIQKIHPGTEFSASTVQYAQDFTTKVITDDNVNDNRYIDWPKVPRL